MFNCLAEHAKRLLLGVEKNTCMECVYIKDVWLLVDNIIYCTKTNEKVNMSYTCLKWKKAKDDEIYDRWYYHRKYIADRKFFEMMKKTQEMIKEWKKKL